MPKSRRRPQQRTPQQRADRQRAQVRPAQSRTTSSVSAKSRPAPDGTSRFREGVEQISRPWLLRLHSMPRMLVPGLIVVGMAVALLAPTPIALLALLAVFAFVGWIAYLSWPAISTGGKLIRIVMLLMIIFVGYLQVQQAF